MLTKSGYFKETLSDAKFNESEEFSAKFPRLNMRGGESNRDSIIRFLTFIKMSSKKAVRKGRGFSFVLTTAFIILYLIQDIMYIKSRKKTGKSN